MLALGQNEMWPVKVVQSAKSPHNNPRGSPLQPSPGRDELLELVGVSVGEPVPPEGGPARRVHSVLVPVLVRSQDVAPDLGVVSHPLGSSRALPFELWRAHPLWRPVTHVTPPKVRHRPHSPLVAGVWACYRADQLTARDYIEHNSPLFRHLGTPLIACFSRLSGTQVTDRNPEKGGVG